MQTKSRGKQKKKLEFSKKIFVGVSAVAAVVVAFTLIAVWRTGDTSPLAYLIPAVFTELAAATGFYYRKAQKENEIKIPHYLAQGQNTQETYKPQSYDGETFTE